MQEKQNAKGGCKNRAKAVLKAESRIRSERVLKKHSLAK
jgi:hypothetical protein